MRFGQVNVHGRENPVFSSGVSGVIPPRARAERSWRQLRAQFFLCFLGCFQLGNLKMSHIWVFDDTLEVENFFTPKTIFSNLRLFILKNYNK